MLCSAERVCKRRISACLTASGRIDRLIFHPARQCKTLECRAKLTVWEVLGEAKTSSSGRMSRPTSTAKTTWGIVFLHLLVGGSEVREFYGHYEFMPMSSFCFQTITAAVARRVVPGGVFAAPVRSKSGSATAPSDVLRCRGTTQINVYASPPDATRVINYWWRPPRSLCGSRVSERLY